MCVVVNHNRANLCVCTAQLKIDEKHARNKRVRKKNLLALLFIPRARASYDIFYNTHRNNTQIYVGKTQLVRPHVL